VKWALNVRELEQLYRIAASSNASSIELPFERRVLAALGVTVTVQSGATDCRRSPQRGCVFASTRMRVCERFSGVVSGFGRTS
jgi:hypothetical protein